MTTINQKEYLKKYLGIGKAPGEKKKKKKLFGNRLTIVDDNIDVNVFQEIQNDLAAENEDAPQIVAVIDERPPSLRVDETTKSHLWQPIGEPTNLNNIQHLKVNSFKLNVPTKERILLKLRDKIQVKKERSPQNRAVGHSPLRNEDAKISKIKASIDVLPSSRNSSRSPLIQDKSEDYSPPRKKGRDNDISPLKINRVNEDVTPPRKHKNDDISPPRRKNRCKESPRRHKDVQSSPKKKNTDTLPSRKHKYNNYYPFRRKYKDVSSLIRNNKNNKQSSIRKKYRDDDFSPARRHQKDDQLPERRRYKDDVTSPPRRHKNNNQSFVRREPKVDDSSPPRRHKNSDQSPVRRKNNDDYVSLARKHRDANPSPVREKERHNDVESPRKRKNRDISPKIKISKENSGSDPLSTRKMKSESRWGSRSPETSSKTFEKAETTLSGKKSGLQSAKDLVREIISIHEKEEEMFRNIPTEISGRDAATIVRDRKERDLEEEAYQLQKSKELKEKYDKWGKGLKQVQDQHEKFAEQLHEMSKPLARYADDEDLERYLKEQEREGDPMLAYIRKKKKKKAVEAGIPEKPTYMGEFMPNRFRIRPGYRWDGVDRSNGYEKKWFEIQNKRKANLEEAHKWSTEDM